jgi:hypothetical protein
MDLKTFFVQFAEAECRVREARRHYARQAVLIRELNDQGHDASHVTEALRSALSWKQPS